MLTRKRTIVYSLNGHDTPLPSSILLPYGGQKHMFPKSATYFSFGQNFVSIHHHNHHMKSNKLKKGIFPKMFTYGLPLKQSGFKLAVKSRLVGH